MSATRLKSYSRAEGDPHIIVRVRNETGTKRIQMKPSAPWSEFLVQVSAVFSLHANSLSLSSDPKGDTCITDRTRKSLSQLGIENGTLLYLRASGGTMDTRENEMDCASAMDLSPLCKFKECSYITLFNINTYMPYSLYSERRNPTKAQRICFQPRSLPPGVQAALPAHPIPQSLSLRGPGRPKVGHRDGTDIEREELQRLSSWDQGSVHKLLSPGAIQPDLSGLPRASDQTSLLPLLSEETVRRRRQRKVCVSRRSQLQTQAWMR